jgi:hypothetical protein
MPFPFFSNPNCFGFIYGPSRSGSSSTAISEHGAAAAGRAREASRRAAGGRPSIKSKWHRLLLLLLL